MEIYLWCLLFKHIMFAILYSSTSFLSILRILRILRNYTKFTCKVFRRCDISYGCPNALCAQSSYHRLYNCTVCRWRVSSYGDPAKVRSQKHESRLCKWTWIHPSDTCRDASNRLRSRTLYRIPEIVTNLISICMSTFCIDRYCMRKFNVLRTWHVNGFLSVWYLRCTISW